jgi:hypothetical protein
MTAFLIEKLIFLQNRRKREVFASYDQEIWDFIDRSSEYRIFG